MAFTRFD